MAIPATLQHGADFRPERVRDQHGHVWMVQAVLEQWQHPASAGETLGRPECIARWVLRVWGPLPGNPGTRGEFTMTAERFGDRPGWWIEPGARPVAKALSIIPWLFRWPSAPIATVGSWASERR